MTEDIRDILREVRQISRAITDDAMPGEDATGGQVACLTEAIMGMTSGLVQIASAIHDLAEAVRESKR